MIFSVIQAVFPVEADLYDESDDAQLSDIQFLAVKEFQGKLRSDEGFLSAVGDLATLTANTGKDMYLARASVTFFPNTATFQGTTPDEAVLKINGVIVESAKVSLVRHTSAGSTNITETYEFKNIGRKVLAGQIIKIEVITLSATIDVEGFIECFEETTGATPRLAALQISGGTGATVNGDMAFLAKKTFDGKLVTNEGSKLGVTGDVATLTASAGKDMFLAKAKVVCTLDRVGAAEGVVTIVLRVNAVIKETIKVMLSNRPSGTASGSSTGPGAFSHEFNVLGLKVATGQIIKTEVTVADAEIDVFGSLVCYEETTGDPPV